MPEYKSKKIESFSDYAEYLNRECVTENIIFRGQAQDWQLIPKLARIDLEGKHDNVLVAEEKIFEQFKLEARPFIPSSVDEEWDQLVLAQHHGLPTRLLDWSKNPLAAMWFAVENPAEDDKPGVVWVFEFEDGLVVDIIDTISLFLISKSCVFRPSHIARRQVAQFGWFTVHAHRKNHGGFTPMEESNVARKLTKLIIPAARFSDMRYHLDRCGVNRASLFPDLDGICKHIEWQNTRISDEPNPDK